jgi:hypothetical protein
VKVRLERSIQSALENKYKLLRLLEMQGTQKPGIDDAEGKYVRANAKSEGQDGDSREGGRFAQDAEAEAQIPNDVLNPVHAACIAAFLFGLLDTAQV